jgi:hypothetical protein
MIGSTSAYSGPKFDGGRGFIGEMLTSASVKSLVGEGNKDLLTKLIQDSIDEQKTR